MFFSLDVDDWSVGDRETRHCNNVQQDELLAVVDMFMAVHEIFFVTSDEFQVTVAKNFVPTQ